MRHVLIVIFIALVPTSSAQRSNDRDAVLETVQIFFDTMTARDVEGARKVLVPEGRFYAMDMRKPKSDPQSFSNEQYFARCRNQNTRAGNESGIRKCACMD